MASDGRIRIDIDMAIDKIMADANKVDKRLQDVGQGTGDQLSEDFDANAEKVSDKSGSTAKKVKNDFSDPVKQSIEGDDSNLSEKVANAKSNLEKLPDETLTELKAEAEDAGITDFDALLEALPEEQITELLAKAEKGEVINFDDLLNSLPEETRTELLASGNTKPITTFDELLEAVPEETRTNLKAKAERGEITSFDELLAELPEETRTELKAKAERGEVVGFDELLSTLPKRTITRLTADAEEHGINNFDKLLKKLPKKTVTELLAKAEKGEVIDYEKLLHEIPLKYVTNLELNDNASPSLHNIQDEAEETKTKFTSLKDIVGGTFLGGMAMSGLSAIGGYLKETVGEAEKASDAMQGFEATMQLAGFGEEKIKSVGKEVKKYADETVYDLDDVSSTTAQLAANGVKGYEKLTEAAGNLTAVAGGTKDDFKSVAMVMTQTAGAGKLTTENWNQLTDAIPGASGKLQEAMKKNGAFTGNFRDAMEDGQISADEFNQAIKDLGMTDKAKEYAKGTAAFEGATGNLRSSVVNGMQDIVDAIGKKNITNAINGLATVASKAFKGITNGIKTMGKWIDKLKDYPAAFKALTTSLKVLGGTFAIFMGFKSVVGVVTGIGKGFQFLNKVIAANKFVIIVSAIVALGAALVDLYKHNKKFRDFVNGLIEGAQKAFKGVVKWFKNIPKNVAKVWDNIKTGASSGWKKITRTISKSASGVWKAIKKPFQAIGRGVSKIWTSISKGARKGWNAIKKVVSVGAKAVKIVALAPIVLIASLIVAVWNKIKKPTKKFWNWMKSTIGGIAKSIRNTVKKWFNSLKNAVSSIWNSIKKITRKVWNPIKKFIINIAKSIRNSVKKAFNSLKNSISRIWNSIKNATHKVWNPLHKWLSSKAKAIGKSVKGHFNSLKSSMSKIWGSVKDRTHKVWNGMGGWLSKKSSAIGKNVKGHFNTMKKGLSDIMGSISKNWHNTWNGISDFFSDIWTSIKKKAKGGINGVIGFLNGGIGGINKVIHTFGGSKSALGKIKKLANGGSGYRGVAMVNDGGGEEAILKGGKAYKVQGKNALINLEGDETVIPHGASRGMFGSSIAHYAGGSKNWFSNLTGWFKDKWDGIVNFIKHPIKSLKNITSKAMGKVTGSKFITNFTPATNKAFVNSIWKKFKSMLQNLKDNHDEEAEGGLASNGVYQYLVNIANKVMSKFPGMRISSGYRPGDPYDHGHHKAIDLAYGAGDNHNPKYFKPANWAFEHFPGKVAYVITQGKVRDRKGSSGQPATGKWEHWPDNDHYDHLHISGSKKGKISKGMKNPGGSGVQRWRGAVVQALQANGLSTSGRMVNKVLRQIKTESNGNPKAVQGYIPGDPNNGNPARGLMQTIPSTFKANAFAGHGNIFNGLDNLLSALRYAKKRYGPSLSFLGNGHGYDAGGYIPKPSIVKVSEKNGERIINSQRDSADGLIMDALNERAQYAPNSFSAKVSHIVKGAQASNGRGGLMPHYNGNAVQSNSSNDKPLIDYNSKLDHVEQLLGEIADKNLTVDGSSFSKTYEGYGSAQRVQRQIYSDRGLAINANIN